MRDISLNTYSSYAYIYLYSKSYNYNNNNTSDENNVVETKGQ